MIAKMISNVFKNFIVNCFHQRLMVLPYQGALSVIREVHLRQSDEINRTVHTEFSRINIFGKKLNRNEFTFDVIISHQILSLFCDQRVKIMRRTFFPIRLHRFVTKKRLSLLIRIVHRCFVFIRHTSPRAVPDFSAFTCWVTFLLRNSTHHYRTTNLP